MCCVNFVDESYFSKNMGRRSKHSSFPTRHQPIFMLFPNLRKQIAEKYFKSSKGYLRRRNDGGNYINLLVGSFIGVFSGNYIFGPILSVHFAEKEEERK